MWRAESTVIDLTGENVRLIREGAVRAVAIEQQMHLLLGETFVIALVILLVAAAAMPIGFTCDQHSSPAAAKPAKADAESLDVIGGFDISFGRDRL